MRKPETIEHLYLDFDGFFASVEQQRDPRLRGRPVGVVPYEGPGRTCIIACSKEAKARGVKNIMMVEDAKRICRDLILVPQKPDLYRRAHNALVAEIASGCRSIRSNPLMSGPASYMPSTSPKGDWHLFAWCLGPLLSYRNCR
jgi:nucleotidyltransferase/DNA polymerase involved in DNA repair